MRFFGLLLSMLFCVLEFSALHAQTNAVAGKQPAERSNPMISFLSAKEQDEYAAAHAKALADNPALKVEGENLMGQLDAVTKSGTPAQQQAIHEQVNGHRQRLREAMLREDPKLAPVFTEIDNHFSELKSKTATPTSSPSNH